MLLLWVKFAFITMDFPKHLICDIIVLFWLEWFQGGTHTYFRKGFIISYTGAGIE